MIQRLHLAVPALVALVLPLLEGQGAGDPSEPSALCSLALAPPGLTEGDYDRASTALLEAVERDPASPLAPLLVRRFAASFLEKAADAPALLERAVKVLSDPRCSGRLTLALSPLAAHLALQKGNEAALLRSGDYFPGFLQCAAAIGPLGDAIPSPLSKTCEPERGLSLQAQVPGLGGRSMRSWQMVQRRPFQPHFDLSTLPGPPGGVRFVKAQIRSANARPAYLRVQTPASVAVWWNDTEVARLDLTTEPRSPLRPIPVVLRAGWNSVLVKLENGPSATVAVGLTDADGRPLEGLEEECQRVDRAPAPASDLTPPPPFELLEDRLTRALEAAAASLASVRVPIEAMLGFVLLTGERPSQGLAALRRAATADPLNPSLQVLLAEATLQARYLPESDSKNRAREAVERALDREPGHVPALLLQAELLARDDRMEDALATLDKAAAANPLTHLVARSRAEVFEKLGWPSERRRAVEEAAAKAPNHAPARRALAREFREVGDIAREERELEAASGLDATDESVAQRRTELWFLRGEAARAIAEANKWVRIFQRPRDLVAYARTLEGAGREKEALAIYASLAEACRDDAPRRLQYLRLARTTNAGVDVRRELDAVLQIEPSNAEVRTWMREIGGGFEGDAFFDRHRPSVQQAIAKYVAEPDHEKAPDVLVLDYQAERVLPDGSAELEVISVHRVNDQRGVEKHGSVNFLGEALDIRVVHPDGSSDEPTPAHGDYALSNLKPGDFVVVRSRALEPSTPGSRVLRRPFFFQSTDKPFVDSQYVLALPKDGRLRLVEQNFDGDHGVEATDQEVVHTFAKRRSPRVLPETMAPSPETFLPWVRAGESYSASDMNRIYRNSLYKAMEVTEEVKTAASEAIANAGAQTDLEKAAALYDFCNDTLLQRGGGTATRSLLERRGSPIALYGALLRSAGIPFELGIARGVARAGDDEPVPHFLEPSRYGVPLVKLLPRDGEGPLWVDLSQRLQPFGALSSQLSESEVFVTADANGRIEFLPRLPERELGQGEIEGVARLTGGQAAHVAVKVTIPNRSAWFLREQIRNATADIRKTMASQISNSLVGGIELTDFGFPNLDDARAPLVVTFEGTVANFLRTGAGGLEAPLLLQPIPLARQYAGRSKRKLPLRFQAAVFAREHLRIEPSPDQRFGRLPDASSSRTFATANHTLEIREKDGGLEVERILRIAPGTVSPAEFPAFLAECRSIEELEQLKVPIVKASASAPDVK